jgi:hypothetical protein
VDAAAAGLAGVAAAAPNFGAVEVAAAAGLLAGVVALAAGFAGVLDAAAAPYLGAVEVAAGVDAAGLAGVVVVEGAAALYYTRG